MQTATAITKYVRVPPRKARLAADIIRGMKVEDAALQLMASQLKAGKLLFKTLHSAIANAESQLNVQRRDLLVKEVRVDAGPVLKRAKAKNKGGRVPVMKRTSHFTIVVSADK
ncbi:MAG: 50S ribosomal protein L22 [Chlamydiae bacterium]|nr:50S ribosomal protein L22 [Chlamydiota bacterium]